MAAANFRGPGRLGDSNLKFFQEPRAHPKIVETFSAFGIDGSQPNPFAKMSKEELASDKMMASGHSASVKLYDLLPNDLPGDDQEDIEESTASFTSFDGVERRLYVFRPGAQKEPLPCVIYIVSILSSPLAHDADVVVLSMAGQWCASILQTRSTCAGADRSPHRA